MTVSRYRTRSADVEAMRFILGVTTRSELKGFVPGANVGFAPNDETDIRWVCLFSAPEGQRDIENDGDWIVNPPDGPAFILTDKQFHERYTAL